MRLSLLYALLTLAPALAWGQATAPASSPSSQPTSAPADPPEHPASAPASAPATAPASAPATAPASAPVGAEEAARCLDGESGLQARIEACRRYLEQNPQGEQAAEVVRRLSDLEDAEEELRFLEQVRHPRRAGDKSLLMVGGGNTPTGIIGVQGGYYLSPQLHLGGGLGINDRRARAGLIGRGYLYDTKFSPMAALALSFTVPRNGLAPVPIPGTEEQELLPVRFGASAMAHASAGMSMRYSYGLSGSVELGYAQPLFQQKIESLRSDSPLSEADAEALRDGGFFFAFGLGMTF